MSISDNLNKEMFRGVSTGQFIGMIIGCAVALLVICMMGSNIIGWFLSAALAFVIAHLFHATPKQKMAYGAVTAVLIILIGGLSVNPECFDTYKTTSIGDNSYFTGITVDCAGGTLTVDATCNGYADNPDAVPVICYSDVTMIVFGGIFSSEIISQMAKQPLTVVGNIGTCSFQNWNTGNLHMLYLAYATTNTDGSGNTTYDVISSTSIGFTDAKVFTGDTTMLFWGGAAYAALFFAVFMFGLTGASWLFRSRMQKARKKMEDDGRLYPQGYGRCKKCGAIVLPGEVECRKCGTYIDRPEEMKPKKVDYFRCTNCGCEVSVKDTKCPKCGAVFDSEEVEIVHKDGSTESAVECPDCGTMVPEGRDGIRICPGCGKRFQD